MHRGRCLLKIDLTQEKIFSNLAQNYDLIMEHDMAIGYARLEYVKRSAGKNMIAKSAYVSKSKMIFDGNVVMEKHTYDWSMSEQPAYNNVLLPSNVNEKYQNAEILWNAAEKYEKRKDAQVGIDMVLALPDDKVISLEDKIYLAESFAKKHFVDKRFGVQIAIHAPEHHSLISEETMNQEKNGHNWHAHLLITIRFFDEYGQDFDPKKPRDLIATVMGGYVVSGTEWTKLWTQHLNEFFEEKGLELRVDPSGIISQMHLGPLRMRGRTSSLQLENLETRIEQNSLLAKDPSKLLEKLTSTKSVFTRDEVERFLQKHVSESDIEEIRDAFWKNKELIQLHNKKTQEPIQLFSTITVVEEERKIIRLADKFCERKAYASSSNKSLDTFKNPLTEEQKTAFDKIVSGQAISCLEGHAGTGKSYLLLALKKFYENSGYTVRAFGPDNATVKVLEERGFEQTSNIHKFLFKKFHQNSDLEIKKGQEVWIVDESGKLGNGSLSEFLKLADRYQAQIIFSGNSAQLPAVERGGMFKEFCARYGCQFLVSIQRQKQEEQKEIAKRLAHGEMAAAVNLISKTGGFQWFNDKEKAMTGLVEKWALDRAHYPYASSLMIAHTNYEVRQLNELAHFYRRSCGELGDKEFECHTAFGKIHVSEGDIIEFRKNDKILKVDNGTTGILVKASDKEFRVLVKEKGKDRFVNFEPKKYTSYQLGYASTYNRSQGNTLDRAYLCYSKQMNKELFYVGFTRHVRNATCFVSRSEARFLSDIKHQVMRKSAKENTLKYTTPSEIEHQHALERNATELAKLQESGNLTDRAKGMGIKAWTNVKSQFSRVVTQIQDRRADSDFYNIELQYKETGSGLVKEVKDNEISLRNPEGLSKPIGEPKAGDNKPDRIRGVKPISDQQKQHLRDYFEKSEAASDFHTVVKSESLSLGVVEKFTPGFSDWQKKCGERNLAAYNLSMNLEQRALKAILGEKSFEILRDQAERYERSTVPKENIEEKLKDNLSSLLQELFPEGPSGKDAKGYRFGAKRAISVVCKGSKIGNFYNFETGEGGGIVQLIQDKKSLTKREALTWVNDFLNSSSKELQQYSTSKFEKAEKSNWKSTIPPRDQFPPDLKYISKYLDTYYTLEKKHPYYDRERNLIFYNLRLLSKDGSKKLILPLSYGSSNAGELRWSLKRYDFKDGLNPIYNSEQLRNHPQKPVLIVEGEKSADAGVKLFAKDYVTVSWFGGAESAAKADWGQLYNRDVIIWPDNDEAGYRASSEIACCLRRVGIKSLKIVNEKMLAKEFSRKWDIADPLPEGRGESFLRDCILRADKKAVGLDRIRSELQIRGHVDEIDVRRFNEVLWRIEDRLRPSLEKIASSKTWEVEEKLFGEAVKAWDKREELEKLCSRLSGHKQKIEQIAYQGALSYAKTGETPSLDLLQKFSDNINRCAVELDKSKSPLSQKEQSYVFDKTVAHLSDTYITDQSKIRQILDKHQIQAEANIERVKKNIIQKDNLALEYGNHGL